jgi:hypothetical protein
MDDFLFQGWIGPEESTGCMVFPFPVGPEMKNTFLPAVLSQTVSTGDF